MFHCFSEFTGILRALIKFHLSAANVVPILPLILLKMMKLFSTVVYYSQSTVGKYGRAELLW